MAASRVVRSLLDFAEVLKVSWMKGALWLALLSIIVSSVRLCSAQSEGSSMMDTDMIYEDENDTANATVIYPPCPTNVSCEDLPGHCIECTFDLECTYGSNTTVPCVPKPVVNSSCYGDRRFNRTFECQYCYQLPEAKTNCTNDSSCNVRGTPSSRFIANCTAKDEFLCLPPRNFTKQIRCNRTSELRWSTAFLLSFTLGGFGVDRFYLQHWGSACGKLVTFGGLGVWSILDVILVGTGYLGPADGSAYVY